MQMILLILFTRWRRPLISDEAMRKMGLRTKVLICGPPAEFMCASMGYMLYRSRQNSTYCNGCKLGT